MKDNKEPTVPETEDQDQFEDIEQTTFTVRWSPTSVRRASDGSFSVNMITNEDPGTFTAENAFQVVDSRRTVARGFEWNITATGTGTTRTITFDPQIQFGVRNGTYRGVLLANAFGTGKPSAAVDTPDFVIFTPTWGSLQTINTSTRQIASTLTLPAGTFETFSRTNFRVEKRSGAGTSGDPYTWAAEPTTRNTMPTTGWLIQIRDTTDRTRATVQATPGTTVGAGVYRIVFEQDALGFGKPNQDLATESISIREHVVNALSLVRTITLASFGTRTPVSATAFGGKIYAAYWRSGETDIILRRYTLAGAYDNYQATIPAGTPNIQGVDSFAFDINNLNQLQIYINEEFPRSSGSSSLRTHRLWRYNLPATTGTAEKTPRLFGDTDGVALPSAAGFGPTLNVRGIAIRNDRLYYITRSSLFSLDLNIEGTDALVGTNITTTSLSAGDNDRTVAVGPERTFLTNGIQILPYSGGSIQRFDITTLPSRGDYWLSVDGIYTYAINGNTVLQYIFPSIIAWQTTAPTVGADRSVRITLLTLNEFTFNTNQFEVQNSSGTVQTGWRILQVTNNRVEGRVIQANPRSSVPAGTYRIALKQNGIETGLPSREILSPSFTIGAPTSVVEVQSFVGPASTSTNPIRNHLTTFTLTLSREIPKTELTPTDFTFLPSPGTGNGTITSVTGSGDGTTSSTFSVTVANPIAQIAVGAPFPSYRIALNARAIPAVASTYLASPSWQVFSDQVYYNTQVSGLSFTAEAGISYLTSVFTLVLDRAVPKTSVTTNNIDQQFATTPLTGGRRNPVVQSVTGEGTETTADTFTILVNNPLEPPSGDYGLVLRDNSIPGERTFATGPAQEFSSEVVTFDRRSAIRVQEFSAPSEIQITPTTTFNLKLSSDVDKTELTPSDFTTSAVTAGAQGSQDSMPTVASVTGRETGNTARNFDVVVTNPTRRVGSYDVTLAADSISEGPNNLEGADEDFTSEAATFDTLPPRTSATVTVPVPQGTSGSIQISLKERSFNVRGRSSQIGPEFQQYLGTVHYGVPVPRIVNTDLPNRLVVGSNDVLIDFNVEVKGVAANAFRLDGMDNVSITNENIFFAATPDPDVPPNAAARNTAITVGTTSAKYYKIRITGPDPIPTGILNIYLRDGVVNND